MITNNIKVSGEMNSTTQDTKNQMTAEPVKLLTEAVKKWSIDNKIPDDHGWKHYKEVVKHATRAIHNDDLLTQSQWQAIVLTALLHDVDDPKVTACLPKSASATTADKKADNQYPIALSFLSMPEAKITNDDIKLILQMISYVSCSKNGDTCIKGVPKWQYIPRDADRSQALGNIGIRRCYEVTQRINNYLVTKDTPLVYDNKSLDTLLSTRSLEAYVKSGGKSASMIDHYYDTQNCLRQFWEPQVLWSSETNF